MPFNYIRSETTDGVLVLTMNDPRALIAMAAQMGEEWRSEIDRLSTDPEDKVRLRATMGI